MSSLVLPLNEVLQNVLEKNIRVHRNGVYEVENTIVDNFPRLLHDSGFFDKAGYLMRWRQRCFEGGKGYAHLIRYRLHLLSGNSSSTKNVLSELGSRMFVGQATTRELLAFSVTYPKVVEALLLEGKVLSAIGRDEFGTNTATAPILFLEGSQKTLDHVPLFPGAWSLRHMFLVRSDRSL